jgi:polypeptide N-acetylgalactosaminyltransferase
MDEYKEYVFLRKGPYFRNLNPGDLTEARELRQRLKCKPFKWFMDEIAFDLMNWYPLIEPPEYGSGKVRK